VPRKADLVKIEDEEAMSGEVKPGERPIGERDDITCPFLKMIFPRTTSLTHFAEDLNKSGMPFDSAISTAANLNFKQNPDKYASKERALASDIAPDLYNLAGLGFVAFNLANEGRLKRWVLKEVIKRSDAAKTISFDDIVEIKIRAGCLSGVTDMKKVRDDLGNMENMFIRAGGNVTTLRIDSEDWVNNMNGLVTQATGFEVEEGQNGWMFHHVSPKTKPILSTIPEDLWTRPCRAWRLQWRRRWHSSGGK